MVFYDKFVYCSGHQPLSLDLFRQNVSEAKSVSIIMCKRENIRTQFRPFEEKNCF
jgi:hypothetical protein